MNTANAMNKNMESTMPSIKSVNHEMMIVPSETAMPAEPLSAYVTKAMSHYFSHLDKQTAACDVYDFFMKQVEPAFLKEALEFCRGNESKTAKMLGISRGTLRKKLATHKILSKLSRPSMRASKLRFAR